MSEPSHRDELPAGHLDTSKMPGHWLLARLGKRVLRPGGRELTEQMLQALRIGGSDDVVEFAPGLGVTACRTIEASPASYTAVERDRAAAEIVRRYLVDESNQSCVVGTAEETGLDPGSATVVYGEAMLSMLTSRQKAAVIGEASRLLRPGGRYGIHELCLGPAEVPEDVKEQVREDLSHSIHVGVRPLTVAEWRAWLEEAGLEVMEHRTAPMHLLEPARVVRDEGFFRALRLVWNLARDRVARERVRAMRRSFLRHREHLCAIAVIARKPTQPEP